MNYVYFLINAEGQIYFGSTNDLRKRIAQHNRSHSRYLKGRSWRLVYYEAYLSEADAREREHQLKQHGQALRQVKHRIRKSLIQAKVSAG